MKKFIVVFLLGLLMSNSVYAKNTEVKNLNAYTNLYRNYGDGYEVQVPKTSVIVNDKSFNHSEINYKDTSIKIFVQDFKKDFDYNDYFYYSLKGLNESSADHQILYSGDVKINNEIYYQVKFKRDLLKEVRNDKNNYIILFKKVNDKALTVMAKSKKLNEDEIKNIVGSIKFDLIKKPLEIEKVRNTYKFQNGDISFERNISEETKKLYIDHFIKEHKTYFGAFINDFWRSTNMTNIENKIDYKFKYALLYHNFNFSNAQVREALSFCKTYNKTLELTFQTEIKNGKNEIYDVLKGNKEDYFVELANVIKTYKHPSIFRIANEMNGDWCSYSAYNTGLDSDIYKAFYDYVYNIFEREGANKYLLYVFNPNGRNFPDFKYNDEAMYRPRENRYDILGLTLYNTGTYYSDEKWESFDDLYKKLYEDSLKKYEKPMMITEFACASTGGDKIAWTEDMLNKIEKDYKKIKVAIWFHGIDKDGENHARIYKMDDPIENLDVLKRHLKSN